MIRIRTGILRVGFNANKVTFSQINDKMMFITEHSSNSSVVFQKEAILALLKIDFFVKFPFFTFRRIIIL